MRKIILADQFVLYQFEPDRGKHFGFNLYTFYDHHQTMLIDTGFEAHAADLLDDLTENRFSLQQVLISHFHTDHISGLKVLPKTPVLGSENFMKTLRLLPRDEQRFFTPSQKLADGDQVTFGNFHFKFIVMPGHAPCAVYTIINDTFIHVGDDLMQTNDGQAILPSLDFPQLTDHIASLERLKEYADLTLLPAHGAPICGRENYLEAVENRLIYLRNIQNSKEPLSYEQAVAGCTCSFFHKEWHEALYA
jgi:glyoxylase-like metal-dependent hydrolase (beta-lactamase superfamily II)